MLTAFLGAFSTVESLRVNRLMKFHDRYFLSLLQLVSLVSVCYASYACYSLLQFIRLIFSPIATVLPLRQ